MKRSSIFLAYSVGNSSVSEFFSKLALELATTYEVVVFSDRKNDFPFPSNHITVEYWPSPRPTQFKDYQFLRRHIVNHRPKLMLSTFGANNLFLLAGYVNKVPHRFATHRTISSHFKTTALKRFRKKMIYKLATRIITNSSATKEDVLATFGVKERKLKVIFNAVYNPKLSLIRDPNVMVYVGRLSKNKGIDVLLEAFDLIVDKVPELKLRVLGGSPEDVNDYKGKAKALKLETRINFLGSQPKKLVLESFAEANFAVVPSLSEGFGFVVIEAFSVGTPVIGSNTGGIKEIIRDGKDGLLIEPGSPLELSQAIIELYGNSEKSIAMGKMAYERFLNTFELNKVVHQMATYLSEEITN